MLVRLVDPVTDDLTILVICDTCGEEGHDEADPEAEVHGGLRDRELEALQDAYREFEDEAR